MDFLNKVLQSLLPDIVSQIIKIQTTKAETARLRAGKRWLGHNEKSAGYLARIIIIRNSARNFKKIIYPVHGVTYIDIEFLEEMICYIQRQLSPTGTQTIIAAITLGVLLEGSKRCPHKSNPGSDGLLYEILHFTFDYISPSLSTYRQSNGLVRDLQRKIPSVVATSLYRTDPKEG
ncbi:hypothetical protein [Parasitella parasitica]|uniref:Uncharacterized protein n=1 Tax=Parasitella parasitica TaxID=35722 RepID=A0A0B7ND54_9FUNG|nr:hypothetical protein [Parasitella parasitica]